MVILAFPLSHHNLVLLAFIWLSFDEFIEFADDSLIKGRKFCVCRFCICKTDCESGNDLLIHFVPSELWTFMLEHLWHGVGVTVLTCTLWRTDRGGKKKVDY